MTDTDCGGECLRHRHQDCWLAGGIAFVLLLAAASISIGAEDLSPRQAWNAVTAFDPADNRHLLVQHLRIPRALAALLVGVALGAAGVVMQALTRNPLADPGILGVNAGAAAGIAIAIAFFGQTEAGSYVWFGLGGAALAGMAVYLLGSIRQGMNSVRVVLAGSALTVMFLALTHIVTINSEAEVFDQFRHWTVGSLEGRGFPVLRAVTLPIGTGLLIVAGLARRLDAVALGDDLARSLGSHPGRTLALAAFAVILLAGAATAAAGPITFLGLTAPHAARAIVGTAHRRLLPLAMLLSAGTMIVADMAGRMVARPGEVGVGIMIALIGGPFFIALVRGRKLAHS
ncbi:FecCD family ABC transporter permease [Sphingobium sp. YR768]|uniref:FecCD family ABC transporter permease n=1 Tax=Sphingobium sp. YR768 TaxID=1884365 RepID=UPI0008AFF40D|nr:iron ABC transporter permease [Sphingobium sp. YR768]SER25688.1 iron complex transport system permease protein [Sphingobium sp. YR768]